MLADGKETSWGTDSEAKVGEAYVTTGFNGLGKLMSVVASVGNEKPMAIEGLVMPSGWDSSETLTEDWVCSGSPSGP